MDSLARIALQRPALVIAALSAAALGGAFVSEYAFGLKPCVLCIWQRWPHAVVILIGVGGELLGAAPSGRPRLRLALALQALVLLVGAGIALYHMGVEWRWWAGTAECTGDIVAKSVEELRRLLSGTKPARCDEPAFVFLGLSMAGWNFLYCIAAAALALGLAGRMPKEGVRT